MQISPQGLIRGFAVSIDNIIRIINKMSSKKAILQLCASEVALALRIIFQKCIQTGLCPDSWMYANVQPIHKKGNRQTKSNYIPISLLPIC